MEVVIIFLLIANLVFLGFASYYFRNLVHYMLEESRKESVDINTLILNSESSVSKQLQSLYEKIATPSRKNDIEKKDLEEIQIDENFRVPIVDGIKVRFEEDMISQL